MSSSSESELIERIHDAPSRIVLAVTGGGGGAVASLLKAPGASRTVLAAMIPYCAKAMDEWLGAAPRQYCSARTARAMAMQAFQKARDYSSGEDSEEITRLAGIGSAASLASDRPKRGPHRYHIGLQSVAATVTWSVQLQKGARSRAEEEGVVASHLLNVVAEASGIGERLEVALTPAEHVEVDRTLAPLRWQRLFSGEVEMALEGRAAERQAADRAVFPGAFNPHHAGHRDMARVARRMLGVPVEYEISIRNVDKPPLDFTEMRSRADQFEDGTPLWFTRAMTFVEKARLFPGATFVVGADTITRLVNPRYYGGDAAVCRAALEEIVSQGCRFLVFGRTAGDRYHAAEDIELPEPLAAVCTRVPESAFRRDISSTLLRKEEQNVGSDF